jgi:hypothetical protein
MTQTIVLTLTKPRCISHSTIPIKSDNTVSRFSLINRLVENPNTDFYQSFGFMTSTPAEKLSQRAKQNKDLHPSRPKI